MANACSRAALLKLATALCLVVAGTQAAAQSVGPWQTVVDDTFHRANTTAGSAGTTTGAGNGWIDVAGGIWNINSNLLQGTDPAIPTYWQDVLLRPTTESQSDSRIVETDNGNIVDRRVILRWQPTGTIFYMAYYGSGALTILHFAGSGGYTIATTSYTQVVGHTDSIDFSATGSSPTTLTATLTDVTASTTLATLTAIDSNGPQVAGQQGVTISASTGTVHPFAEVHTYDRLALSAAPDSIGVGTTGTSLTLTEANAAFTPGTPGTPVFTMTGGTGASITSQTVTSATTATLVVNAGSALAALSITDPSSGLICTVNVATVILPNDTNVFYSPYTWLQNGAVSAQTNNTGAYAEIGFSGTGIETTFDVSPMTANSVTAVNYPFLRYQVDGGTWNIIQLTAATKGVQMASGLAIGSHVLRIWVTSTSFNVDRWVTPQSVVRITGFWLDGGSTSVAISDIKPKRMIVYSDSTGAGYTVNAYTTTDSLFAWPYWLARGLNAEVGNQSFEGEGWAQLTNMPINPPLYNIGTPTDSKWDRYDLSDSRLVSGLLSPAPDYIVVELGINDAGHSTDPTATIEAWLPLVRAAAPTSFIFIVVPFTQADVSQITTAFDAYLVSNPHDGRCFLINPGLLDAPWFAATPSIFSMDGTHPNAQGEAEMAATILGSIKSILGRRFH